MSDTRKMMWPLIAAMGLCLAAAGHAKAGMLYDNGPINGTEDAWNINGNNQLSESFTLAQMAQLTGVQFGVWEIPGNPVTAVDWVISTGPAGDGVGDGNAPTGVIASGTAATTDTFHFENAGGYDIDQVDFSVSVTLAPGLYYISLSNIVAGTTAVYWDQNDGPSTAYQRFVGNLGVYGPAHGLPGHGTYSESFQLSGDPLPSAAPEPASLTLLGIGCVGLMGYAGLRRKRAAKVVPAA